MANPIGRDAAARASQRPRDDQAISFLIPVEGVAMGGMSKAFCDPSDEQAFESLRSTFRANTDAMFIFIGAGLSKSAAQFWEEHNIAPPSGLNKWDRMFPLWNDLAKEMAGLISADTKEVEEFIRENDAIDVAEHVKTTALMSYQNLIYRALFIPEQDLPAEIPPAHEALIRLNPKTLVTSNLDQLLEFYYNRINKYPPQIVFDEEGMRNIQPNTPRLIKLHGCISRPSSWVMTRREYAEVWRTRKTILDSLKQLLRSTTCLFAGYSLRDTHFNALYDEVLYQQQFAPTKLNFCVVRGPVNALKRAYWRSRGLNLIGVIAWEDLARLFEQLLTRA